MKKFFLLFTLLFNFSLIAFSLAPPTQAVEVRMEFDSEGNLMIFANNKDYCEYYLAATLSDVKGYDVSRANPYITTVRKGESKILTLKRLSNSTSYSYNCTYMAYRGRVNPKLNMDFVYSLPVKPGDSVQAAPEKSSGDFTLVFDLSFAGDTIYACREGRVCDDNLTDQTSKGNTVTKRIIVNHKDESFSEYSYFEKALVYPGEYVKLGQPVAINTGKTFPKRVTFAVYYLDKNKVQNTETGSKYSHLVPVFHTLNAEDLKLEENTVYICEVNEHLITQEMSDREKKKYEKKKGKK